MKRTPQVRRPGCSGFTLAELLIASTLSLMVVGIALTTFITVLNAWRNIERRMQADSDINLALSHLVYGMDTRLGLRCASAMSVTNSVNANGWKVTYRTGGTVPQNNSITYSSKDRTLIFNPGALKAGRNISFAQVIAGVQSLVVTMRVDKVDGVLLTPQRVLGTEISFRNY